MGRQDDTVVASFTDTNTNDTSGTFTASINWGDGTTTTTGSVSGGNGNFTVTGGHTYADEGSFPLAVTITDTSNNKTLALSGTVAAAEADVFTPQGITFTAHPGQAFSVTVASFTDTNAANTSSDFSATIDWGDGSTPDTGTITFANGAILIGGTHTYANPGYDTVTVTLTDDAPGTASASAISTAKVVQPAGQLNGQASLASATEGAALASTTSIATFTDTDTTESASAFTASINWGDGTTTTGTVTGGNGAFTVSGGHTYAEEGQDTAVVTITRTADGIPDRAERHDRCCRCGAQRERGWR